MLAEDEERCQRADGGLEAHKHAEDVARQAAPGNHFQRIWDDA